MTRVTALRTLLALTILVGAPGVTAAQEPSEAPASQPPQSTTSQPPQSTPPHTAQPPSQNTQPASPPAALDDTIDAGEAENPTPVRRLVSWNEYDGRYFSIRVGGGFLYDYVTYSQDANSETQFDLIPQGKLRDARVLLKGRLKFKRPTTYSVGYMYDAANAKWVFRQTGIMVAVPEIWGDIFVGRSKEGPSLNKVMVGYAGWTLERQPTSDATLPILADGVKWLGYLPNAHLIWNVGVYGDAASEGQTFSTYSNQVAGRFAWLPLLSPKGGTLLHLGVSLRYGKPKNGTLRLKARPETWAAPYFVDTGEFAASDTKMAQFEVYYRPGRFAFGSEYFLLKANAPASGNPLFHGGDAFASWLVTGETRVYNTRGGYFDQISPKRPVFHGGPGAWELVAHFSSADFNSGTLTGGTFWRFTPVINWYLSDNVRLEIAYGYGSLNRFGVIGNTQFFQTRLQLQL